MEFPRSQSGQQGPTPDLFETHSDIHVQTHEDGVLKKACDLQPGERIGHFLLLEVLGAGAMGVVFLAHDASLQRKVAIKLLHKQPDDASGRLQKRLLREAQAMAKLSHPNVVAVYEVGTTLGGQVFVAMEYVAGQTLAEWVRGTKRHWRDIVSVLSSAGAGLAAAHEAGLVHRDFKPANVLIGTDGRVRVTDFGLVGTTSDDAQADVSDVESTSTALSSSLTRAGTVVGTPRYMAPEQFASAPVDGRTDQFSFCVTLYECLFGYRPFKGDTLEELRKNTIQGRMLPVPKTGCGKRIRRALLRGLSTVPGARHPCMNDLLCQLGEGPLRRHRVAIASAACMGLVAATAAAAIVRNPVPGVQVCETAASSLGEAWNGEMAQALRSAFAQTGVAHAREAADKVVSRLDAYGNSWIDMRQEACRATHLRGEQSEELLDLRMACLDRRKHELGALVQLLTHNVDVALVDESVVAVVGLQRLSSCADSAALMAPIPPPSDVATRDKVLAVQNKLDEMRSVRHAGLLRQAQKGFGEAVELARQTGYAPVLGEALMWYGRVLNEVSESHLAEEAIYEAIWVAEAGHNDVIVAEAWQELFWLVGSNSGRFQEAQRIAKHAEAALARLGKPDDLVTHHYSYLGNMYYRAGRYEEARQAYEESLRIGERAFGKDDLRTAAALSSLSAVYRSLGNPEMAITLAMRSLEVRRRGLGEQHPRVAGSMVNLGIALSEVGQTELGLRYFEEALALREASGIRTRAYGIAATNLGDALRSLGRHEEALRRYIEAEEAFRFALAEGDPLLAYPLTGRGLCLVEMRRHRDSIAFLEQALALRRGESPESMELAETRFALAQALWRTGDRKRARQLLRLADAAYALTDSEDEARLTFQRWLSKHNIPSQSAGADDSAKIANE